MKSSDLYFIMTVDVDPPIPSNPNPYIVKDGVATFLKIFDKYAVKATFFVPAVVAESFPEVMHRIINSGHEVACHGLKHNEDEATLGTSEQLRIIKTATEIIQSVTGVRAVGFRAPVFRVNKSCWIALQKNDYVYDSSIIRFRLSRNHRVYFQPRPFYLSFPELSEKRGLIEIPISVNPFFPFPLGGAYMRIFGSRWSMMGLKINFCSRNPVVFHIHPKDIDSRTTGRHWWSCRNTSNCVKMLEEIIKYSKQSGAKFITAYELAMLFEGDKITKQSGRL